MIQRMKLWMSSAAALVLCSMAALQAHAAPITLTMDDLPSQPVNGLVHPAGVTFGFTIGGVGSTVAVYNAFGPGTLTFVQDPSIEGNASGVLTLNFAVPTPILEFGVAGSALGAIPNGALVELFDASNSSLGTFGMTLSPLIVFAEGQFVYSGVPVSSAVISFAETEFGSFAFDNLTFDPDPTTPIPEPASLALWCIGALGVAVGATRRRRRQSV